MSVEKKDATHIHHWLNSMTGKYQYNAPGMTFNSENLPIFYPNIPIQNDSFNYGMCCLNYIKMLYQHSKWNFLDGTSSDIVGSLLAIMIFQNIEAIHSVRISTKEGIKSLASSKT